MKLTQATLIMISGAIWLLVGFWLLSLGVRFLIDSIENSSVLIESLSPYAGGYQQAALLLIAIGLGIGFLKGKFVLSKSVERNVVRIQGVATPSITQIYCRSSYIILAAMMCLGMVIKYLGIPNDIRGLIDVAVGSALLQGGMLYFRHARMIRRAVA